MKKRINPIAEPAPLFSFDAPFRWPGMSRLKTMLRPRTKPFHTVMLTKCVLPVCSSCGNYSPQGGNRDAPVRSSGDVEKSVEYCGKVFYGERLLEICVASGCQ